VYVDLAELEEVFGRRGLWSTRWPAVARFCREDHLGASDKPLDMCVRDLAESRTGHRPLGPIRLLTNFRSFGFLMNPVSFYYCFNDSGGMETLVAEVSNTPWNERHCYVLDLRDGGGQRTLRVRHAKQFHVSPFLEMDMDYQWSVRIPDRRLALAIENICPEGRLFTASLTMRRIPLTLWNRCRVLACYPALAMQVFAAIYWQALRLWWKGAPFVPHPGRVRATSSPTADEPVNPVSTETACTR